MEFFRFILLGKFFKNCNIAEDFPSFFTSKKIPEACRENLAVLGKAVLRLQFLSGCEFGGFY